MNWLKEGKVINLEGRLVFDVLGRVYCFIDFLVFLKILNFLIS